MRARLERVPVDSGAGALYTIASSHPPEVVAEGRVVVATVYGRHLPHLTGSPLFVHE